VARTADYALRTPIGTGIYNDLAGTVVCDFSVPTTGGTFKNSYWIGDNSTNQNALNTWAPNGSGNINVIVFSGGGSSVLTSYGAIATNTRYKVGAVAQLNDFATAMNGSAVTTDASGAMPVGVDRVIIGSASGPNDHLYGHIRRLDYWPERKVNSELQRLTS
jgi:Na+-transporting methylmalonyl-CoA/oxaloacetate decarboxylase beta subunit